MAALQKTFSGDLTQSIAGKIYAEIRKYDDEKRAREADPKVKKAAEELNKEDDKDLPVVIDSDIKGSVTKIFGKLSADIVSTEGKVDDVSAKVTNVAGELVDIQKLIINQNEMLEQKFGIMLSLLGGGDGSTYGTSVGGGGVVGAGSGRFGAAGRNTGDWVAGMFGKHLMMKAFKRVWKSKLLQRPRVAVKLAKRSAKKFASKGVQKLGGKIAQKTGTKAITKILGKGVGKTAAKKIPGLSLLMGAGFAAERFKDGDVIGGTMELLSGGLSTFLPGWGTVGSLAIDAMLLGRDIEKSMDFNKGYKAGLKDGQSSVGGYTGGSRTISGYEQGTEGTNVMGMFKNAGSLIISSILPVASITGTLSEAKPMIAELDEDYPIIDVQRPSDINIGTSKSAPTEYTKREDTKQLFPHTPPEQKFASVESVDVEQDSSESKDSSEPNEPKRSGKNQWWDFLDWFANPEEKPEEKVDGGSVQRVQPTETIMGGAVVTQRNDPDAEQTGIDVALKNPATGGFDVGAPIMNPFEELTITDSGFQGSGEGETGKGYGKWVTGNALVDGKKYELLVAHLDTINVKKGDVIEGGDIIGTQGITGRATGPHVSTHINALDGGNPQDILNRVEKSWVNGGEISTDAFKPTGGISINNTTQPPIDVGVKSRQVKLLSSETEGAEEYQPQVPIVMLANNITATSEPIIITGKNNSSNNFIAEYRLLSLGQA